MDALAAIIAAAPGGYALPVSRREAAGDGYVDATALTDADLAPIDPYPPVAGQWLLERHAWLVGSLAAALLHHGHVCDLRPQRTLVLMGDGMPSGLAVRDDPVPGDGAAARASIRAALAPLAAALAARRVRPERALWRSVDDRIAYGALWTQEAFPDADASRLAGELGVELRPYTAGDGMPGHRRASCCLAHRAQEPVICEACPLMRARRFRTVP